MIITRNGNSNPMWGGRFAGGPAAVMREINASIGTDKRIWREDIAASRAHAAMLGRAGILSEADAKAIDEGLNAVGLEIADGKLVEDPALEDIHMHVEHRLGALIGEAAGRLHTARSRNDQVATDFKLFVRGAIDDTLAGLAAQGILSSEDAAAIDSGLAQVAAEIADGKLVEDPALEDIHMHVEHRLGDLIGPVAGRLHTARSRNDQVATDFKLWVRGAIDEALGGIDALEDALLAREIGRAHV